jgi:glycosyltransferase involved in cell wall biosynthesis
MGGPRRDDVQRAEHAASTRKTSARPRVAFNALSLRPDGSGVQRYAAELLHALVPVIDATLIATVLPDAVVALPREVEARARSGGSGAARVLAGARSLPQADLVHGLNVHLPIRRTAPAVATVHDLAVYDVPWTFRRRFVAAERAAMALAMRRADILIADSSFTADRISARFGRDATVVPLAASAGFTPPTDNDVQAVRSAYSLPPRFVLFVGTVEPRKDVKPLAAACRGLGVPLVMAGRQNVAPPADAIHLGYVPGADLAALYGASTVVGYPSLYEGFGLPPLEAMACGTPVLAYRIPPLVETLGDAAVLVSPGDEAGLRAALRALVLDPDERAARIAAGRRCADGYTWAATAAATADVYRGLGVPC